MQLIVVPNISELIFFLSYLTYLAQKGSFEESNVYAHAKKIWFKQGSFEAMIFTSSPTPTMSSNFR